MAQAEMISMFATTEQNMNAVERVVHYSELSPEGIARSPSNPPPSWPTGGMIKFTDVKLAYREGLPLVLKGVDFQINPGEKVGLFAHYKTSTDNFRLVSSAGQVPGKAL
jgi:ATP-binding cassette, subfamily C (CFTR/MRP), member 1